MIIFILILISACDFTPRLQKEILIAQEYLEKQEIVKAIGKYEEILKVDCPDEIKTKIYYQLGELYSTHLFKNRKAINYFKKIKLITSDPEWLYKSEDRIAEIKFTFLNNIEAALKIYEKLIKFKPELEKHDFYEYRLGLCLIKLEREQEAINHFKKIIKNKKHGYRTRAYYELGYVKFKNKMWQKAIDNWKIYLSLETRRDNIVRTKYLMANAYETMESLEEAYNIYYSILGEYPNTQVIQNRLNSIYERRVARKR